MMTTLSGPQAAQKRLRFKGSGGMDLDFSAVTRPVERLMATAQNGLEVLRLGGLETGGRDTRRRGRRFCWCTR